MLYQCYFLLDICIADTSIVLIVSYCFVHVQVNVISFMISNFTSLYCFAFHYYCFASLIILISSLTGFHEWKDMLKWDWGCDVLVFTS